jgi:translation initiation factor 2 beta subunit (eIF-2beta)/eIF-5
VGKPKKILFQLINRDDETLMDRPYELLDEVRAENHFDTAEAKIALAWKKGTKPDADGRLVLGRCVRASDLQRELVDYDFVIVLNKEVWDDPEFGRDKKLALLDHEMCHAARVIDDDGEKKIDSKGRPVWRTRGHDIEEFREIVDRHGIWKRDLEKFAEAILRRKKSPLLAPIDPDPETVGPGFLAAVDRLASSVRTGEASSITISTPGMDPVVIDKQAADNIHKRASRKPKLN